MTESLKSRDKLNDPEVQEAIRTLQEKGITIQQIEEAYRYLRNSVLPLKTGDFVRHKKIEYLARGEVLEIAKSGVRAGVWWSRKNNPRLLYDYGAYYRLDLLEKVE